METVFRLRFLGPIQVERDGTPVGGFRSRKALALLAYLAAQARPVPRDHLAGLFWEDKREAEGRANLSWVLNKLGQLLPGCWQADRHTVQFVRTRSYWLDVDAFESLVAQREMAALAEAVQLYRGEFLEGLELDGCAEFGLWLVGERERWRQCTVGALDELVAHHNRRGAHAAQLLYGRRLLLLEPWREETHRQLMRLLARSGQRSAALAQYEACRQTLANELAVERQTSLSAMLAQMIRGEVERDVDYSSARARQIELMQTGIDLGTDGKATWTRDELYEAARESDRAARERGLPFNTYGRITWTRDELHER